VVLNLMPTTVTKKGEMAAFSKHQTSSRYVLVEHTPEEKGGAWFLKPLVNHRAVPVGIFLWARQNAMITPAYDGDTSASGRDP